jgi:hypothetical protein
LPQSLSIDNNLAAFLSSPVALLLGLLVLALLVKAGQVFRIEFDRVDSLVSEYVRCRDFLLSSRQPSAQSGWRTVEGEAFREAWRNFNVQLEAIAARYRRSVRPLKVFLAALLAAQFLVAILWMTSPAHRPESTAGFLSGLATAVTWFLPGLSGWIMIRVLDRLLAAHVSGNALIAPWPADGGTPEKHYSAFEKFLPVELSRTGGESTPEVL